MWKIVQRGFELILVGEMYVIVDLNSITFTHTHTLPANISTVPCLDVMDMVDVV